MTWFNIVAYLPPQVSSAGTLGAVGGGWTDVGTKWKTNNVGGGSADNVIQITDTTSTTPWTNAQIVRAATIEQTQNAQVRFRWMTTAGGRGASPFAFLRYVKNTTDATPNGFAVQPGQLFPVNAGVLGSSVTVGAAPALAANAWFDTQVTITTSGSNITITEQTWTVANHVTDSFGAGSSVTNNTFPNQTAFAAVSGSIGLFAYQPGTLNVQQFTSYSDIPTSALALTPLSASVNAGSPVAFTLTANGAQNGGAVTLSDGGKGGTFSPATVTLSPGAGASASFSYTPAAASGGTSVTVTASSAALTGSAVSGTASVTVSAAPATALQLAPATQSTLAGTATGSFTVAANGVISSTISVSLSATATGGTFNPSAVTLTAASPSTTFTYTPPSAASGSITLTAAATGLASATASVAVTALATALTISPSAQTVLAGAASYPFTVTANGALSTTTTISLSDGGAGGAFSPASLSFGSGSSTGSFTYTPPSNGSGTVTLTAAGSGLASGSGSVTITSAASLITPTNPSVVLSPYNWASGLANSTSGDNSAVRAWNPGAYARVYVKGTTSIAVIFGNSNTAASFSYQIDDGVFSQPVQCPSAGSAGITLPDTGSHSVTVMLFSLPQAAGRWAGTNAITLNGFQPGAGGSADTPIAGTKRLLIYGDSIAEGIQSRDGADGVTTSFAFHLGEAYRRQGWEYGIKAAGASGLSVAVSASLGGQPPAWTSGSDVNSSWNKIDGSGIAGASLTTGTVGSASERFIVQPQLILVCWGTNDGLQSVANATITASALGLQQRLRVAAPGAVIAFSVPFGGFARSAIQAAATSAADRRLLVLDLKADAKLSLNGFCGNLMTGAAGSQTVHPWSLASAVLAAWLTQSLQQAYVPFTTARPFGSAS